MKRPISTTNLLGIGFIVMTILMVVMEVVAVRKINSLADSTENLYRHPLIVSKAALRAQTYILRMHRSMKDVALATTKAELEAAVSVVSLYEEKTHGQFAIINDRFLGDKLLVEKVQNAFRKWLPIRAEVIELKRAGKNIEASRITVGKGAEYVSYLTREMESFISFASGKADQFLSLSRSKKDQSILTLRLLMLGLLFVGAGVSLFVIRRVRASERRVLENEARYRSLVEGQDDLICRNLPDTTLLMVNDAYVRFFGREKKDFHQRKFLEFVPESSHREILHHLATFSPDRPTDRKEHIVVRHDGEKRWMQWTNTATFDDQGVAIEFVAVGRDITEQRHTETLLRQSQKMEAIGQLASGIAHDFNNMLNVVMGSLVLLRRKVTGDPKVLEYLDSAFQGCERGVKIIRKLLVSTRKEGAKQEKINVNQFIQGMEQLIAKSLTPRITVETHLAEDIWDVRVDSTDFGDALLNLAINARDAMPDGGTLVIETSTRNIDARFVELNPGSSVGAFVAVSVSDTGVGMPPVIIEKAFQPFFTTKKEGQGTGLGLSMVYGFIKRSGGYIKIYSEVGRGTTIRILLPRDDKDDDRSDLPTVDQEEIPRGCETVLVVDDEEGLLMVAKMLLDDLGYTVLTARNGVEAIDLVHSRNDIDLLLTDVVMPGPMDGYGLSLKVRAEKENLKILLTSGFTAKREALENDDRPMIAELRQKLLSKPFNQYELARAVRRTLDGE